MVITRMTTASVTALAVDPVAPAPEWFLIGIFNTEDGPCVSWARRLAIP